MGQPDFFEPIQLSGRSSICHELAFTEHYVLIIDQCIVVDTAKIVQGEMMGFDDKHNLRLGLLRRDATKDETIWFEADRPIGMVHAFSAWEEGDTIIFWVPGFTDFYSGSSFELDPKPFEPPSRTRIMELRMNVTDPQRRIEVTTIDGEY